MTQTSSLLPKTRAIHRSLKNCDKLAIRNSKRSAVGEVTKRWLTDTGLEVKRLRWCHHGALSWCHVNCHLAWMSRWCQDGANPLSSNCCSASSTTIYRSLCRRQDKARAKKSRKIMQIAVSLVLSRSASISASSKMTRGEFLREREIPILRGSESRPPCPIICGRLVIVQPIIPL